MAKDRQDCSLHCLTELIAKQAWQSCILCRQQVHTFSVSTGHRHCLPAHALIYFCWVFYLHELDPDNTNEKEWSSFCQPLGVCLKAEKKGRVR